MANAYGTASSMYHQLRPLLTRSDGSNHSIVRANGNVSPTINGVKLEFATHIAGLIDASPMYPDSLASQTLLDYFDRAKEYEHTDTD